MKYTQGNFGRVFCVRFDHGDDVYKQMTELLKKENVKNATIQCLGAMNETEVVVGPSNDSIPAEPMWDRVTNPHEVCILGTAFDKNGEPGIHLHSVFSRRKNGFIGCIRKSAKAYIIVEAIITEIIGVDIKRDFDSFTELHLMNPSDK